MSTLYPLPTPPCTQCTEYHHAMITLHFIIVIFGINIMYAPQLAWFPDNGSVPYPGYSNQREKNDWLNSAIIQENRRNNVPEFPGFHTYGVRKATRKYTDWYGQVHHRAIKAHRWEHWRESEPASMLHLRNDRRIKMAMALNKYLIINTDCT